MRISEMLTGARGDLVVKVFGPDNAELARIAAQIQTRLKALPGTSEALTMANDRVDYLQLDIDRLAAGRWACPSTSCRTRCARRWKDARGRGGRWPAPRADPDPRRARGQTPQTFADQTYRSPPGNWCAPATWRGSSGRGAGQARA
jgi:cobalt-zinc-cadmium resistance protein CzcA